MPAPGPIDRVTHLALRAAVLAHRESEHRRRFSPVLHAGRPGTPDCWRLEEPWERLDAGLRVDVAAALLHRLAATPGGPGFVWLTRAGDLVLHDADAAWSTALETAASETGLPGSLVVVTRDGWWDPRSGACREWRRLRRRSA